MNVVQLELLGLFLSAVKGVTVTAHLPLMALAPAGAG